VKSQYRKMEMRLESYEKTQEQGLVSSRRYYPTCPMSIYLLKGEKGRNNCFALAAKRVKREKYKACYTNYLLKGKKGEIIVSHLQ
jgi:hypothetical protein